VLSTWRVHWVRVEPAQVERWWTSFERVRTGAWARGRVVPVAAGASEQRMVLEGGASELWRVGASERLVLGASEWLAQGASWALGASEWAFGGASAFLYGGSSAMFGASERTWSSQWLGFGSSELGAPWSASGSGGGAQLGGASERWSD